MKLIIDKFELIKLEDSVDNLYNFKVNLKHVVDTKKFQNPEDLYAVAVRLENGKPKYGEELKPEDDVEISIIDRRTETILDYYILGFSSITSA